MASEHVKAGTEQLRNKSATLYSLPADGTIIYATLYSLAGGQWLSNSYTYISGPAGLGPEGKNQGKVGPKQKQ